MENINLYKGDCLEVMDKLIEQGIKVDAIITDPPYGTTACKWDSVIPFDDMWQRLNKLIKPNGAIVLFGSEPFSSALRVSNIKNYRYDIIWEKSRFTNFLFVKKQIGKIHENISIFYKNQPTYNPQMENGKPYSRKGTGKPKTKELMEKPATDNGFFNESGKRYPKSIQKFPFHNVGNLHPTQKPVELIEFLVKTYTNENEIVLDFTMGSGTTGVACVNTNRKFIGIELDDNYFEIAKNRINNIQPTLF